MPQYLIPEHEQQPAFGRKVIHATDILNPKFLCFIILYYLVYDSKFKINSIEPVYFYENQKQYY